MRSEFLNLGIPVTEYRELCSAIPFFEEVLPYVEDAVTGQRGDGNWYDRVRQFYNDLRFIWVWLVEPNTRKGRIYLDPQGRPELLAECSPELIATLGLLDTIGLLRSATAASPEIEAYNGNRVGADPILQDLERDRRFIEACRSGLVLAALRRLDELTECNIEDVEAVLKLKPIFDSLSIEQFQNWKGRAPKRLPEGGEALAVPYPNYHPVVKQWWKLLYETPFYIDPYASLPEDPTQDGVPFSVMGAQFPPEYFENATLNQVRRYMLLCTRGERFCDGYIAGEFERGTIQAAFARLQELSRE